MFRAEDSQPLAVSLLGSVVFITEDIRSIMGCVCEWEMGYIKEGELYKGHHLPFIPHDRAK